MGIFAPDERPPSSATLVVKYGDRDDGVGKDGDHGVEHGDVHGP